VCSLGESRSSGVRPVLCEERNRTSLEGPGPCDEGDRVAFACQVLSEHVDSSVLCFKSPTSCYGSMKMIRFSYSNEDAKDEEKERVESTRND